MTMVRLVDLHIARETWPRQGLDEERVQLFASLLRSGEVLPPIEIVARGDGTFWIADGVHRCHAAGEVSAEEMEALVVIPVDPETPAECAYRRALETASTSSLPLTMAERRLAAIRLLKSRADLTHRAVSRMVGVAHSSVDRWAREVAGSASGEPEMVPVVRLPAADEAAWRLVGLLTKLDESRGLLDYLAGSRMGRHMADAFEHRLGEKALVEARKFSKWLVLAVQTLEERS
jgi:ParB-like chromosome segregation protein Spo0J